MYVLNASKGNASRFELLLCKMKTKNVKATNLSFKKI